MLIYFMSNLSYAVRLSADVLTEQRMFFGLNAGWAFEILVTLGTALTGFSLAGLCRSITVDPKSLIWPGVLPNATLNHVLHDDERSPGNKYDLSLLVELCGH